MDHHGHLHHHGHESHSLPPAHSPRGSSSAPLSVQLMRQFTAEHERELKELLTLRREVRELRSQVHHHRKSAQQDDGDTELLVINATTIDPPNFQVHVSEEPCEKPEQQRQNWQQSDHSGTNQLLNLPRGSKEAIVVHRAASKEKNTTDPSPASAEKEQDAEAAQVTEVVDLTSEQVRQVRLTTQSMISTSSAGSSSSRVSFRNRISIENENDNDKDSDKDNDKDTGTETQGTQGVGSQGVGSQGSAAIANMRGSTLSAAPRASVGDGLGRRSVRETHRSIFCCNDSDDDENSVMPYYDDDEEGQNHLDRVCEMCADFAEIMGWTRGHNDGQRNTRMSVTARAAGALQYHSYFAQSMIDSFWFDPFCTSMILLNSALIGASVNWAASTLYSYGNPDDLPLSYRICNYIFTCIFTIELLIRILAAGSRFVCGSDMFWNWFDSFVVAADLTDTVLSLMSGETKGGSSLFLRMLRVLRLVRTLRVIRVVRFFRELRMMVYSILKCSTSLAWAVSLVFLIIYIFGLYFMQQVIYYLNDVNYEDPDFDRLKDDWGSVEATLYTLFACFTDGKNWADVNKPLIRISALNALTMAFFIFVTSMFLANILTGIFVETAIQSAQSDRDEVIQEQMMQDDCLAQQIREILHEMDTDKSGFITLNEFEALLRNKEIRALLKSLGLEVDQAKGLFKLLDIDHSRAIGIEEFVYGCVRLKGNAKSIDLATLMFENKRLVEQFRIFFDEVRDGFATLAGFETRVDTALAEIAAQGQSADQRRQGDSVSSNLQFSMYNSRMLAPYGGRMNISAARHQRQTDDWNQRRQESQQSNQVSYMDRDRESGLLPHIKSDRSMLSRDPGSNLASMSKTMSNFISPQKWKGPGAIFSMPGSRRGSAQVTPFSTPGSRRPSQGQGGSRRPSQKDHFVADSRRGSRQDANKMDFRNSPMPMQQGGIGMLEPIRGSTDCLELPPLPTMPRGKLTPISASPRTTNMSGGRQSAVSHGSDPGQRGKRELNSAYSDGDVDEIRSLDGSDLRGKQSQGQESSLGATQANKMNAIRAQMWGFFRKNPKSQPGNQKRISASAPASARHSEESTF